MPQDKRSFSYLDVFKALLYFLDQDKKKFVVLNIVFILCSAYFVIPMYLMGYYVDQLTTNPNITTFWVVPFIYASSAAVVGVLRTNTKNTLKKMRIDIGQRARVRGFERLMLLPLSRHAEELSGNKVQRIQSGATALQEWVHLLTNSIYPVFTNIFGPMIAFAFLSPKYLLFFAAYLGLYFVIERFFATRSIVIQKEIQAYKEKMSGAINESVSNTLAIKALGMHKGVQSHYAKFEDVMRTMRYQEVTIVQWKWSLFNVLYGIGAFLFLYMIGADVVQGALTAGMVVTFFGYLRTIQQGANDSSEAVNNAIERRAELERMMPLFWETDAMVHGDQPFPARWKQITFTDVTFGYEERKVFEHFNMVIEKSEIVGIRGASGAGKSTLIKLLMGFYMAQEGEVKIGNSNVGDIEYDQLVARVGLVLQEPELFSLSLRDNITVFGSVNELWLKKVIRLAGLESVIAELPNGIDTLVGEKGYALSGGQRQRLGIARALYKDAPILVMDEATSALDPQTEAMVMNSIIDEYKGKKTIIIIAHRETTLSFATRIISLG